MLVSIGSGLTQTLKQQLLQQQINDAYLQNANSFLDLGGKLDLLGQFANARNQGLSPTQALLGINQTALNPVASSQGLSNFLLQSQSLAPVAAGAALQGSTGLLDQLNASIGVAPVNGTLQQADLLSAVAPFSGPAGISALQQQANNDRFLGQSSSFFNNQNSIVNRARRTTRSISDLQRLTSFNRVTPQPLSLTSSGGFRGAFDLNF